jgi:mycothiol system anti-sigma-R factor
MKPCDDQRANVFLYLDKQLSGRMLEAFLTHLRGCPDCKGQVEEEQALSQLLRRSRPLYTAPEGLRDRVVAAAAQHHRLSRCSPDDRQCLWRIVAASLRHIPQLPSYWTAIGATIFVLTICLGFVPNIVQRANASAYVDTALASHRGYLNGQLPLEIRSDSAQEVMAWFADKLPFQVRLPNSQPASAGRPAYRLMGARLLNYKDSQIAFIEYEMQSEKISLLVAPTKSAAIAGGDEVRSGSLAFHYRSNGHFKVITWSNHQLSYALVSSLKSSARQSCLVCHQSMTDPSAFAPGQ